MSHATVRESWAGDPGVPSPAERQAVNDARASSTVAQPRQAPRQSMSMPELNRRLVEQRGAMVDTITTLRRRVRRKARNLMPYQQLRRHPEAGMALAAVVGLIAGRVIGRVAGGFLR